VRTDPAAFAVKNLAPAKSPRFVVLIEFDAYNLYLSSHTDIEGVVGDGGTLLTELSDNLLTEAGLDLDGDVAVHIAACLMEPSITSQKLNPDQGRAEIGAASFTVSDPSGALTTALRELLEGGEGLRGKLCRFYLGYQGLDFSDFQLVGTQIVKSASFDRGSYRVACNDVQRSARKDIFDLKTTTLSQSATDSDATLNVYSTAGFELLAHGSSYSDAASSLVGYIKVGEEVIRYTGTTPTSFTGCTRGVLGTTAAAYTVDSSTAASRRQKVTEYVYLELPGPKLAYAILTGELHGTSDTLPSGWHLAIDPELITLTDFTDIGLDLWDTTNDAKGILLRFEGLTKTDGKAFLETEICRLLGLYMPVYADGTIGIRRMTRVLSDATAVLTLDETNSVQVGELEHDMESLHNAFFVSWNWNGSDYTRATSYIDADSASIHGTSAPMSLKFKGLYGGIHTDAVVFKLLDSIRDRYSAPPQRLSVEVFHSLNRLEVGDVVRVHYQRVRDYAGPNDHIDRAFEVQSISVNHRTGSVSLDLFGSTSNGTSIESPTQSTSALPDAFYTATGTNLATVMTISSGVVSGGPYTLTGGTNLTSSVWYYDGDLTIASGVTVNITGNVQIRVKGYLTHNGTISGVGGGLAGVVDNGTATVIAGNPGWVGNARGNDGICRVNITDDFVKIKTQPCALTQSKHAAFPYVQLEVVDDALNGLPTDLRGTGGGPGGKVVHENGTYYANGGTGGTGGAGLCTISRGFGIGANGRIDLSGDSTSAPAAFDMMHEGNDIEAYPGAGGAGGPGGFLCLIDGALLSVPDFAGRFVGRTGTVNPPASYTTALAGIEPEKWKRKNRPFAGYLANPDVISAMDYSFSAHRIQYVPASETETTEPDSLAVSASSSTLTKAEDSAAITSAAVGVSASRGSAPYTYAWTKVSGGSITIDSAAAATTTFSVSGMTTGEVRSAVMRCTVTDSSSPLNVASVDVTVTLTRTAISLALAPTALSRAGSYSSQTTSGVTATASNGAGGYSYAWTKVSGDSITIGSASSASTTFSAVGLDHGEIRVATFRCTATDLAAATTTKDIVVTIHRYETSSGGGIIP
jgi:hypothetical protein